MIVADYMLSTEQTVWRDARQIEPMGVSSLHWEWLQSTDSLTARFAQQFMQDVSFRFIRAGWGEVFAEERTALTCSQSERNWVREISWSYNNQTWVVARTVIPASMSTEAGKAALNVGAESIGKTLFKKNAFRRGALEIARLDVAHPYSHWAESLLGEVKAPFWARRSVFQSGEDKLLVSEVFLPSFFSYNFAHEDFCCKHK